MIKTFIKNIFDSKVDALGLSIFRIAYAIILLCETLQLYKFRHVIYDDIPFQYVGEINVQFIFWFWFVILGFLLFGLFTRLTTILNYIFGVIIFSSAKSFEYHVFYAYVGINFLLLFIPISRVFSLDSLLKKLKYTNIGRNYKIDRKVLEINYLILVFAAVGLVYFDSIFQKLSNSMWLDGLGMWLPSSLPMATLNDTSFILNQEGLVKFLGYLVIVFETVFIFLLWFRKARIPLFLLGVFFHTGILIVYPIPWFALTAIVVYLLLIPQKFWLRISEVFKSKNTSFSFYYDAECPLCNKVVVLINHFDVFKKINCVTVQIHANQELAFKNISESDLLISIHGVDRKGRVYVGYDSYIQLLKHLIYTYPLGLIASVPGISHLGKRLYTYIAGNRLTERCTSENCLMPSFAAPIAETEDFLISGWNQLNLSKKFWKFILVFMFLSQCLIIWFSATIQYNLPYKETLNKVPNLIYSNSKFVLIKFFGITVHPVFMYEHFKGYNHIFKVICNTNKSIVPLLDNDGLVTNSYANGAFWVNYTFRVNSPKMNLELYQNGMKRYLRYFEKENKLKTSSYTIYIKEIEVSDHWQKDFLHKQMAKPWFEAGQCSLNKTDAVFTWNEKAKKIFEAEKHPKR